MRVTIAAAAAAALACLTPAAGDARTDPACAGPYRLEVLDASGRQLPTFTHRGRTYVLGSLGERYVVRVHNRGPRRVEAVVSVDGLDVVDGRAADTAKRGYLVDPGGTVTIDGFRLSTESVAAFRFSSVPRSYAAQQGDARDVGVIGVAVFPERERPRLSAPPPLRRDSTRDSARGQAAPEASARAESDAGAPASAPSPERADARMRAEDRPGLGTEFGEERDSSVRFVSFERASPRPAALLTLRYDDRDGLIAAGVDVDRLGAGRREEAWVREQARPFRQPDFAPPPPGWGGAR